GCSATLWGTATAVREDEVPNPHGPAAPRPLVSTPGGRMSPRSHPSHRLGPRPGSAGPQDPAVSALVQLARNSAPRRVSRRSLLAGAGGLGLASLLAACGTGGGTTPAAGEQSSGQLSPAEDRSAEDPTLRWSNWTLYLDYDDAKGVYPTLQRFQEESG